MFTRIATLVFLIATLPLSAVTLRVVTFNIETNRGATGFPTVALNDPGTSDFDSVRDILLRIDADVICLQEVARNDIPTSVDSLADALDLDYVHTSSGSGVFDTSLRNVVISRYPINNVEEIGTATYMDAIGSVGTEGGTAKDVTRAMPAFTVEVPGASSPTTIITLHNKALSSPITDDKFRQAVELARVKQYLDLNGLDDTDNIVVLGDFNLGGAELDFTEEPTTLPSTYNRGSEILLSVANPIEYKTDPSFYFTAVQNLNELDPRDLNNSDRTTPGGSRLDFILTSPAIIASGSEIYRSSLDTSNSTGLDKEGSPLNDTSSTLASDHYAVFADLELEDALTTYTLTDLTPSITENFDLFDGASNPSYWTTSAASWQGIYNSGIIAGTYAFDDGGNRSVGILPGANPTVFTTNFINESASSITDLDLSILVQQQLANDPGTSDSLTATYSIDGGLAVTIPEFDFTADPMATLPSSQTLSASLSGLNIPIGSTFSLNLTAMQGAPVVGSAPDTAFINEFHYDNTGGDLNEFVEVVVSPGFTGDLNTMEVILYNGNGGGVLQTHSLSSFDNFLNPGISNGYTIYSKAITGIQNGAPDGIALIADGNALEFISYEGSFTATEGPADGMTSTDIVVSQTGSSPTDEDSLGRTGSGAEGDDFTWVEFEGITFSQGLANDSQTFTGIDAPSQAFSFDNVFVGIASNEPDNDNDGDPDSTDPDDDNDGIPDLDESILGTDPFLADSDNNGTNDGEEDFDNDGQTNYGEIVIVETDPRDPNSHFETSIRPSTSAPGKLEIEFPTLSGRNYQLWSGSTPQTLAPGALFVGDGSILIIEVTPSGNEFYKIEATLPRF
ncbi:MAG: endonuclease/exonuclease/phosphatase family protein [Opitutaceae bacterium]